MTIYALIIALKLSCIDACEDADGKYKASEGCICVCEDELGEFLTGVWECEIYFHCPE